MSTNLITNNPHRAFLEEHLKQKRINRCWLQDVLDREEKIATAFPYRVSCSGVAKIVQQTVVPIMQGDLFPTCPKDRLQYVVNIPLAHLPLTESDVQVVSLLTKLKEQSFGENAEYSEKLVKERVAVVIGINQISSIDNSVNRAFIRSIKQMVQVDDIPYRVFGFRWEPMWVRKGPSIKRLYDKKKAFLLVKCLAPEKAKLLRNELETNLKGGLSPNIVKQIPFQKIRQHIKNSTFTSTFAQHIADTAPLNPIYFVTMDGDLKKLRTRTIGYFSHYNKIIADSETYPSAISLGYKLDKTALPIVQLAVDCDRKVRDAMNDILPGSVYLPEPGTGYYLSNGAEAVENLEKFSFVSRSNRSEGFESRRALANGIQDGIFKIEDIVFKSDSALVTSMPGRMRTKTTEKYKELHPTDLKKKEVLKALRGVSQVHFAPLDWAHYVYEALPRDVKQGVGVYRKISGILSRIFAVFDPLSLVFNYAEMNDVYFHVAFDRMFSIYGKYAQAMQNSEKSNAVNIIDGMPEMVLDKPLKARKEFIHGQFLLLLEMKKALLEAGFEEEWIRKIIDTACASGKALFKTLIDFFESEEVIKSSK